jgi:uncharacterized BrkB/YihY/UPF0761 family membrane protein
VAERDTQRLGGLLAGALAYRMFLWLLPFTLLVVGTLGALTSIDEGTPGAVADDFGLHGTLAEAVSDGARQTGWWIAILIGLFGTLWAGVGAERAVRVSHAAAWGLPADKARSPVRATLSVAAIALLILGATALAGWLREAEGVVGLIATFLIVGVYFLVWMFVQVRLPHRRGPWTQLVPGALLVAIGAQAIHLFTVWYLLGRAERAASTYGAIGTALVILVWLYVVARLVVGAAVLNAELAREHAGERAPRREEEPEREEP